MSELGHKEGWALKNWCFQIVVLEKTLEGPLDRKELKPVSPKENQSWIFFGRTDAEAEAPILWPPDVKSWLTGKDSDAGKIEGRRRSGWQRMRWLDGIINSMDMSLRQLRETVEQGSLACCSPGGHKELDTTEWENNKQQNPYFPKYISSRSYSRLFWTSSGTLENIDWISNTFGKPHKYPDNILIFFFNS